MFTTVRQLVSAALLFQATICLPQAASAQVVAALPQNSSAAIEVGQARPIAAWTEFCQRVPSECLVDRSEPAQIALTPKVWQTIVAVNKRVNTAIRPMTDEEHWGLADKWDIPADGFGDCEDYQLLKRKLLAEAGFPRRAMRMTVVLDEKREGHAVLTLRTDRGDYVLDNKSDAVTAWYETGYTFVKRESQDGVSWTSLGGAVSPTVTANR
jgi:predicted transglutaminase-like cysteine proteinase